MITRPVASRRQSLCFAAAAGFSGICSLFSGCNSHPASSLSMAELQRLDWQQISALAAGSTVRIAMWDGDPAINRWMRGPVAQRVQELFRIKLHFTGLRGRDLVWRLMAEQDAGRQTGDLDVIWINGETFYQLRQVRALAGPFTSLLPNQQLINWNDPFISEDFQQPVDGYECPWGSVQFTLIHHSQRVPAPRRRWRNSKAGFSSIRADSHGTLISRG